MPEDIYCIARWLCIVYCQHMQNFIFAFDLDGTVTQTELLPLLGRELGIYEPIMELTRKTLGGELDFETSFRLRFEMLNALPLEHIHAVVNSVQLNPDMAVFINRHSNHCRIITGNLDRWIAPLREKLRCPFISSKSVNAGGRIQLAKVLHKGEAISNLARLHPDKTLVAIGESAADIPMFEAADFGIAYAGVHQPMPGLLRVADYLAADGAALCELLHTLPATRKIA